MTGTAEEQALTKVEKAKMVKAKARGIGKAEVKDMGPDTHSQENA